MDEFIWWFLIFVGSLYGAILIEQLYQKKVDDQFHKGYVRGIEDGRRLRSNAK